MDITDIRVFLSTKEGATRAYVHLTFDDVFVVRNIKVVAGKNGLFVSMPAKRLGDGEFQDICFPITAKFRKKIQKRVIETYKDKIAS